MKHNIHKLIILQTTKQVGLKAGSELIPMMILDLKTRESQSERYVAEQFTL